MKVIYLHGYKGENSSKFKMMEEYLSDYEVDKPEQIENSPLSTIKKVSNIIESTNDKLFIVASSRGGIFGQYLSRKYDIPILLINPVFKPYDEFKAKLREDFNKDQIEEIFSQLLKIHDMTIQMDYNKNNTKIWLSENDEVLDHEELIKHYDKSCFEFYNTDHRFSIFPDKLDDLKSIIEKYQ